MRWPGMFARLFVLFMALCLVGTPAAFAAEPCQMNQPPSWIALGPQNSNIAKVPYFFGKTRGDAGALARSIGLKARFVGARGAGVTVVSQSMPGGREFPQDKVIVLTMAASKGGFVTVPSLVGLSHDAAASLVGAVGLKALYYGSIDPGTTVGSQLTLPGKSVARGTYIQLRMNGGGSRNVTVANFFGRTRGDAGALARSAGLKVRFVGAQGEGVTVVSQSVPGGTELTQDKVIVLTMAVSKGGSVGFVTVPFLVGLSHDAAASLVEAAGLKPQFYGSNDPGATVVSQLTLPGKRVARGTVIQLKMGS